MDDEHIIKLYYDRDEAAIRETAAKYGTRLRRISFSVTEDDETASECENDTYMEAWNSIPPNNPIGYFFPYLARIIRHLSIDACRTRNRLKRSTDIFALTEEMEECIPADDHAFAALEEKELGAAISRYLHTQSKEKQILFVRRYFYMDSVEALARKYGMGESKVKMTLFRMRNELGKYLEKEGYFI